MKVWIVFQKELLDVLRDRRTLFFMLVLPILVTPLLLWASQSAMVYFTEKLARKQARVLVENAEAAPEVVQALRERANPAGLAARLLRLLERFGLSERDLALVQDEGPDAFGRLLLKRKIDPAALEKEVRGLVGDLDEMNAAGLVSLAFPPNFEILTDLVPPLPTAPDARERALLEAVRTDRLAASVRLSPDARARLDASESAPVSIRYLETSDASDMARRGLERVLRDVNRELVAARIAARSLPEGFAAPLEIKSERLPGPSMLVKLLGMLLPYMILIAALLGALYPAIDLGAGEKERGTIETLLVAPVSRAAIVLGKWAVVLGAALVSAILSTVSLYASLQIGLLGDLAAVSASTFTFGAAEAAAVLLLTLPVAGIFSSLMLALSIFAKSFKEGQSYAGLIQIVIILPAMVSFLPGVQLDWTFAAIPLVNVSLALKEIFTGNLDQHWAHVGVIFLSTTVCAALLLWFAAWWFRREQVLFRA